MWASSICKLQGLMLYTCCFTGEYGCIGNGQLSVDRTDPVDGYKGVMMKLLIGIWTIMQATRSFTYLYTQSVRLLSWCTMNVDQLVNLRVN